MDIVSMRSTVCLWKTEPSEREKTLNILEYCLIPATREQAKYWINRSLSHYNRRDVSKDAVIVVDLSYDMIERGASTVAIVEVLREFRHKATKTNPWWPTDGDILDEIDFKMKMFRDRHEALKANRLQIEHKKPEPEPPMTPEERKASKAKVAEILKDLDKNIKKP